MTREQYQQALHRCEVLMAVDPAPESRYGKELTRIAKLIEQYERLHFPTLAERHDATGGGV